MSNKQTFWKQTTNHLNVSLHVFLFLDTPSIKERCSRPHSRNFSALPINAFLHPTLEGGQGETIQESRACKGSFAKGNNFRGYTKPGRSRVTDIVAVGLPIAVYGVSEWSDAASPVQKPNYAKDAILLPAMRGTRYRVCASSLSLVLFPMRCVCIHAYQLLFMDCASSFCLWTTRRHIYVLLSCNNLLDTLMCTWTCNQLNKNKSHVYTWP